MKLYSSYANASIQMKEDLKLLDAIKRIADQEKIDFIFETGTYQGTGSTSFIASCFRNSKRLKAFYTTETNLEFYRIAKKNLKKFPFVKCLYGLSVSLPAAEDFLQQDEVLSNHEKYNDIYIDDTNNPKDFYLNEIRGMLRPPPFSLSRFFVKREQELIKQMIPSLEGTLFIVLDSSGGIGYLEFTETYKLLQNRNEFYILLDDTHHLKHFRSKLSIEKDKNFTVLASSIENGWLLAHFVKDSHV